MRSVAVQTLVFTGLAAAGNFTLTYNGIPTAPINFAAGSAAQALVIQNALNAAAPAAGVTVVYSGVIGGGVTYTITFNNPGAASTIVANGTNLTATANNLLATLSGTGVNAMLPFGTITSTTGATGTSTGTSNAGDIIVDANKRASNITPFSVTAPGTVPGAGTYNTLTQNDVQTLTLPVDGGSFTLSFAGQTTVGIPFNSTIATIQAALTALPAIGAGNVVVTGTPTTPIINFQGTLAGSAVPLLSVSNSFVNESQAIEDTATVGSYQLVFGGLTTTPIAFNATAIQIQAAIDGLSTVTGTQVASTATLLSGTAAAGTNATTLQLQAGTFNATFPNYYVGYTVVFTNGIGGGQSAVVTASTTTGLLTFATTLATAPGIGTIYTLTPPATLAGVAGAGTNSNTQLQLTGPFNPTPNFYVGQTVTLTGSTAITGVVNVAAGNTVTAIQLPVGTFNTATANFYAGYTLVLTSGPGSTGAIHSAVVASNTVGGLLTLVAPGVSTAPAIGTGYTLSPPLLTGTAVAAGSSATTLQLAAGFNPVANFYVGDAITITAGVDVGQTSIITAMTAGGLLTVSPAFSRAAHRDQRLCDHPRHQYGRGCGLRHRRHRGRHRDNHHPSACGGHL